MENFMLMKTCFILLFTLILFTVIIFLLNTDQNAWKFYCFASLQVTLLIKILLNSFCNIGMYFLTENPFYFLIE